MSSAQVVRDLLEPYDAHVQELVAALRNQLNDLVPDLGESVRADGKTLGYVFEGGTNEFCIIAPQPDRVDLYFPEGHKLADPNGLMKQTDGGMRYVPIRDGSDIHTPALGELIHRATALSKR